MDLDQVTLTQLRYAIAVEKHRNFRRASEACGISQSGLSMQLQKLEELLGLILFDRTKRPVEVTAEGQNTLKQMRAILQETARLGRIATDSTAPSGPYRLGVIPTMSSSLIPLFINEFTIAYPHVDLTIDELKTETMVQELHNDTLDGGLAAIPLHTRGIIEQPLAVEPLVAYLPPDDALLRHPSVSVSTFSERELWLMPNGHCFRDQSLAFCDNKQRRKPRNVQFESGHFDTIITLVDQGVGATLLPALVAQRLGERQEQQTIVFDPPLPARQIGFITSRRALRRRITQALITSIVKALTPRLARYESSDVQILPP